MNPAGEGALILIVEDESHLADGLRFNLEAEGHRCQVVETGEAALDTLAQQNNFNLVLLDVMLPGVDGFAVAAELRRRGNFVPVMMLTARGRVDDVLKGFEAGADDYLPKPFDLSILFARVTGLLRRSMWIRREASGGESETAMIGDRVIDFRAMEIRHGEETHPLTLMEMNLLRYLIRHPGEPLPRAKVLEEVWGVREDTDTRAIDNFIVRLRRLLEDEPAAPRHLLTVRGVGYRLVK